MPWKKEKYPTNWSTEIVPKIRERSGDNCENCGLTNGQKVWSVNFKIRDNGRYKDRKIWFRHYGDAKREFTIDDLEPGRDLAMTRGGDIHIAIQLGDGTIELYNPSKNWLHGANKCNEMYGFKVTNRSLERFDIVEVRRIEDEVDWEEANTIWKEEPEQKTLEQRVAELERKIKDK